MNNIKLESHGYTIVNDNIAALRLIKNSIRKGGIDKCPETGKWLNYSFKLYAKYQESKKR